MRLCCLSLLPESSNHWRIPDLDGLNAILGRFDGLRVLVVGDLMVDEHIWGNATRVSPEAPVLVVEANGDPEVLPGGAANVANNIKALGGAVSVVGVVGGDPYGEELTRKMASAGIDTSGIVVDSKRITTRKTRIWVSHRQQVVRVDREAREPVSGTVAGRVLSTIIDQLSSCDALIMSDYNKGLFTSGLLGRIVKSAKETSTICAVNAKPSNIKRFKGAEVIVVNQSEAEGVVGYSLQDEDAVMSAGRSMLAELNAGCVVITRGAIGLSIFDPQSAATIAAIPLEVYDVAGAGDTVISSLAMALAAKATPFEAGTIANLAGGAAVRKLGVAAVTRDEIVALNGMMR